MEDHRTAEDREFDETFQDLVLYYVMALTHPVQGENEVWNRDALTWSEKAEFVADMREEAWDELEVWERPPEECPGCDG